MLKSEWYSRDKQDQLPNMPEITPNHEILGIPQVVYQQIQNYCNCYAVITDQAMNAFIYEGIVKELTSLPTNKDRLKIIARLLKEAAEAYIGYTEILTEA